MTDEQFTELIRARDADYVLAPPASVWDRVGRGLDDDARVRRPPARMRALRRTLSIAASLAAVALIAWLLWPAASSLTAPQTGVAAELEDVELEATDRPRPVIAPATYEGVRIREGVLGRDVLRSCVAC